VLRTDAEQAGLIAVRPPSYLEQWISSPQDTDSVSPCLPPTSVHSGWIVGHSKVEIPTVVRRYGKLQTEHVVYM
jgi:hypothetical protein